MVCQHFPKKKKTKNECYTAVTMISEKSVLADSINKIFLLLQGIIIFKEINCRL